MATYTDNYQLTKPTYAEQADIGVVNSNMNKIDNVMHSSQISLAPAYDQSKTYAEGDVVMYELLMYKCISPTTGAWDGSKWERTTASESGGGGSAELDILGEGNGAVVSFADGASAELAKCIAEIVPKQAGTGTPSLDNVRAISGYTAVKVDVAGKNLLNGIELGAYRAIDAEKVTASNRVRSSSIFFLKQGTYTFSASTQASGKTIRAFYQLWANDSYGANTPLNTPQWESNPMTFTLNADTFVSIILGYTDDSNVTVSDLTAQLEKGSTATTYEPYTGSTTTTALGQTVYGGQLNVLTGELTIDRAIVDLGTLTWQKSNDVFYATLQDAIAISADGDTQAICSCFDRGNFPSDWTVGKFVVSDSNISGTRRISVCYNSDTTVADFTTLVTGQTLVYTLATPQTVQLTPQEVNSLLGQNNISADTGDVDIVYVKASAPIQPNPTGEPTATLKKLSIEGAVFELEGGGGGSSSGINYSTTEQVIGTWIDGKPLYAKTIEVHNLASGNNTVSHNIANLKMTVENISFLINNNNYTNQLPAISTVSGWSARARDFGLTTFVIELGSEIARYYTDAIVTMFYTKITD